MGFKYVKKSRLYRQILYYLLYALFIFQIVLLVVNLLNISHDTNLWIVMFNFVFLSLVAVYLYKHILPKYKYKIQKATFKWLNIKDDILIVEYPDKTITSYNFTNVDEYVTKITFGVKELDTTYDISKINYNIMISLSNGNRLNLTLNFVDTNKFLDSIPNKALTHELKQQVDKDKALFNTRVNQKTKLVPSIICFGCAAFSMLYLFIVLFGYSKVSGSYYATDLVNTYHNAPINNYSYMVEQHQYSSIEPYTISFGANEDKDIIVFYNKSNPNDSYTMYTIDFLTFITLTLISLGCIMLNKPYSPYFAIFGLSIVPFYFVRLLNINAISFVTNEWLIVMLSMLSIPVYLLIAGILKLATDILRHRQIKLLN